MTKYLLIYHGGDENPGEDMDAVMAAWSDWFQALGAATLDGGNPVAIASTMTSDGSVHEGGGKNPASGYSLIEAKSMADAQQKARGCPILTAGGTIEICETVTM